MKHIVVSRWLRKKKGSARHGGETDTENDEDRRGENRTNMQPRVILSQMGITPYMALISAKLYT